MSHIAPGTKCVIVGCVRANEGMVVTVVSQANDWSECATCGHDIGYMIDKTLPEYGGNVINGSRLQPLNGDEERDSSETDRERDKPVSISLSDIIKQMNPADFEHEETGEEVYG